MGIILVVLWVAVIIGAVAWVLLNARKESHDENSLYNDLGFSKPKKPRVVSTKISYTPAEHVNRGDTAGQEFHTTSENPVYVKSTSSVVEVRALRHTARTHASSSDSQAHNDSESGATEHSSDLSEARDSSEL